MVSPRAKIEAVVRDAYRVHTLRLGPMDNLVYLIEERQTGRAAVIDPAWDVGAIACVIEGRRLSLTDVLITHGHDDHVNGLRALLDRYSALVVHATAREAEFWRIATAGETEAGPPPDRRTEVWSAPPPARLALHEGASCVELGGLRVELIPTPGHSPGGCCWGLGDDLFTGDTLFVYGCGRCDLPGSDPAAMFHSLRMLRELTPDPVVVRPGHHYAAPVSTPMAEQRRGNPFLHFDDEQAFIAFRAEHNRHRLPPYRPVPAGARAW